MVKIIVGSQVEEVSEKELWDYFTDLEQKIPLATQILGLYMIWITDPERYRKVIEDFRKAH